MGCRSGGRFGWRAKRRAEAGSDFVAAFTVGETPSARWNRVNVILHESQFCCMTRTPQNSQTYNLQNSHACSLHDVHVARSVQNSLNSVGDRVVRGRGVCVPGETKSLSTSTRLGVGRPAVEKLASPQLASERLHEETWAGLLQNQGPKIFREVEIVSGCAVAVACPSCPPSSSEPPGPGRIIRNMLEWSGGNSSVWGMGVPGCPSRGESFFFPGRCWRLGQEGIVPHSVGGSL